MTESKESLSLRSRFKNFIGKGHSTVQHEVENEVIPLISDEFWVDISPNNPAETRINKLNEYQKVFKKKQMEKGVVEKLWLETKDLLSVSLPASVRESYFEFLLIIIQTQYRNLGMLRTGFYREISKQEYVHHTDFVNSMLLVNALTDHGKSLSMLEIGKLLVKWMDEIGRNQVYLSLLLNVVKFNSSHLGQETIQGIVFHLCQNCSKSDSDADKESLLKVLDAIVCYNSLPPSCLRIVIATLCRTLCGSEICKMSWSLMRNLLGTHLGNKCVREMCSILEDPGSDPVMLRSAVFYVGKSLWGSKLVSSLMYDPQTVLPSFYAALDLRHPVVGYEVVLTLQRLVSRFGHELPFSAWKNILNSVDLLFDISAESQDDTATELSRTTHEVLNITENLHKTQAFGGSVAHLFEIIEKYVNSRPVDSVLLLLSYKFQSITPAKKNWIKNLQKVLVKFYSRSMKEEIRLKFLDYFKSVVDSTSRTYNKEMFELLVTPEIQSWYSETNGELRNSAFTLLKHFCLQCETDSCIALLTLMQPALEIKTSQIEGFDCPPLPCPNILPGLADIFAKKFGCPDPSPSNYCLNMLVHFLEQYYEQESLLEKSQLLWGERKTIFDSFFQIRANSKLQLKLESSNIFNPNFLCVPYNEKIKTDDTASYLNFQKVFLCFIHSLENENCWPVLQSTFTNLCSIMKNRTLIATCGPRNIDLLAEALCILMNSNSRYSALSLTPEGFKKNDLQSHTLKTLASLTLFYEFLDVSRQRQILRCLETGFNTKCAKQCISSVTQCIVEMSADSLLRVLPSILSKLSQMSATVHLATVVLELLSTLSQLPKLYTNFVEEQYMSVFAIALQHTNPGKFGQYIVSLAHHAICMWFVKCRLSFRPDFVRFITHNLQTINRASSRDPLQHSLVEACIDVMAQYTFSDTVPVIADLRSPDHDKNSSTWLLDNRLVTIATKRSEARRPSPRNHDDDGGSPWLRRKQSLEAPAKLQSIADEFKNASRQRHRSDAPSREVATSTAPKRSDFSEELASSSKAEIVIRRPSGNTAWSMANEQLSLKSIESLSNSNSLGFSDLSVHMQLAPEKLEENGDFELPLQGRHRSHTVDNSDYKSAAHRVRNRITVAKNDTAPNNAVPGQSPSFLFLQLFHSAKEDDARRPLLLPNCATVNRAVHVLDRIPSYDTWSTGVVYVQSGQTDDCLAILSNEHGSPRYQEFLNSLGRLICLAGCDMSHTYLGGLDHSPEGEDGLFTYVWQENIMQMVFHVATLMPNNGTDVSCKQRHIGNDYITIVYDDNPKPAYVNGCVVKGQFLSAEIMINPLEDGFNVVQIFYHKPELEEILQINSKMIISDKNLGVFVRQLALHANMAANAFRYQNKADEPLSKPLARLKQIKRIRTRVFQELAVKDKELAERFSKAQSDELYKLEEFSDYV